MSKEDDLFNDIEKNLEKEYNYEYEEALLDVISINSSAEDNNFETSKKKINEEAEITYGDVPRKKRRPQIARESQLERDNQTNKEPQLKKKKKKKYKGLKILLVLLLIILVLVFSVHAFLTSVASNTDYQPYETEYIRASDVKESPFVTNILVIGSDARSTDVDSRSDSMIVVSINRLERKIVMTSILRDSYVTIPGYGGNKINAAFQYGGANLLIQTIEENFKIGIDYYINIDFFSFVNIIDELGGVTIDVDDEELPYLNSYLKEINGLLGEEEGADYLSGSGELLLDGKQALSYSRIRYVGTDFARTSRQREVINAVISQLESQNPLDMYSNIENILSELVTNIPDSKMAWYVMEAPFFLIFEREEFRVPADDTWTYETIDGLDAIRIDFDANISLLQDMIY